MQPLKQDITPDQRMAQMRAFVDATPFRGAPIHALRPDASVRNFFRVEQGGKTAILMDARPPLEDTAAYVLMRDKFDRIGLTVPEIHAADHALGLVLMEDFGDTRYFERVTNKTDDLDTLYNLAVDGLVHKYHADPEIALAQSVAYSDDYWLFRVGQFLDHYYPAILNRAATEGERADFLGVFREALNGVHKFPPVLLHGDYVVQNLYYLPDRPGLKALGLIDFQDMTDARGNMMGSPAFDLVFLLQDVRVDLPADLEDRMQKRFLDKTGITDIDGFKGAYAAIGAAQATKCLGLFARLGAVAGRKEYLQFIPYCLRNLRRNLPHPHLAAVRAWFEKSKIDLS